MSNPKKELTEIEQRLKIVGPRYADGLPEIVPADPQEFLDWVWQQAQGCNRCLLSANRTLVVKPDGLASADIMIVGEGPGFMEDLTGIPLVGPPELRGSRCNECSRTFECFGHRILWDKRKYSGRARPITCNRVPTTEQSIKDTTKFYLQSAGTMLDGIIGSTWGHKYPRQNWVDRYENQSGVEWAGASPWFITNATMCRSWDLNTGRDTKPNNLSRKRCEQWLVWQWAAVNPKVIVCLGRVALWTFMGSDKAAQDAEFGQTYQTKFGPVIALEHPAHLMRKESLEVKGLGFARLKEALRTALVIAGYEKE